MPGSNCENLLKGMTKKGVRSLLDNIYIYSIFAPNILESYTSYLGKMHPKKMFFQDSCAMEHVLVYLEHVLPIFSNQLMMFFGPEKCSDPGCVGFFSDSEPEGSDFVASMRGCYANIIYTLW